MRKPIHHITTFPKLRTVYLGPLATRKNRSGAGRNCHAIEEALQHSTRQLKIRKIDSLAEAVKRAQVVISLGSAKKSFGKPTLKLEGELNGREHSDEIRRFLRSTKATSVVFAFAQDQSYWKVFKVIRYAFDWTRRDFATLTHEQKQEIRE